MKGDNNTAQSFFDISLSGFLITDGNGIILKANTTLAGWLDTGAVLMEGKKLSDFLGVGSRIFFETHLSPLIKMQGFFDEVVAELMPANGIKQRVLMNAILNRTVEGQALTVHYTFSKATHRLLYEQNLQQAKVNSENKLSEAREDILLREQLIAVLGHDLRNPLGAISMATQLLEEADLGEENGQLLQILKRSNHRMKELISNIMDFARTRMGSGIILQNENALLQPVLEQVIKELQLVYPERQLDATFNLTLPVYCDPARIAQLASNLLANAYTHGDAHRGISIKAVHDEGFFVMEICNYGNTIPEELQEHLFEPFTREEAHRSQNGLGLGLYISAAIARAHGGTLHYESRDEITCFVFKMPGTV